MKKLIFFLGCTLMIVFGLAAFSSCGDKTPLPWSKEAVQEIATESADSIYYNLVNPTFTTVSDVVDYRDTYLDGLSIDSIFYSLPDATLKRVADVCINKSGATDKKQIVQEYLKNKHVYSNMSEEIPIASNDKNNGDATGDGGSGVTKSDDASDVFETSYNYYTDTIDGKPVKVQVKTEKSYEKH